MADASELEEWRQWATDLVGGLMSEPETRTDEGLRAFIRARYVETSRLLGEAHGEIASLRAKE